jgi:formate hydrogenlyase subunit 6/NADH:ubiquinone oxidoreductase subunit I
MTILDLLLRPLRTRRVTEAYPERESLPVRGLRGTPVFDPERCDGLAACQAVCPTGAIGLTPLDGGGEWRLDYGLCIFCGECVRACPSGAITPTDAFELAQVRRTDVVAVFRRREATDA